jgi:hypothetical protein
LLLLEMLMYLLIRGAEGEEEGEEGEEGEREELHVGGRVWLARGKVVDVSEEVSVFLHGFFVSGFRGL